jgi:phosphatidylglycerol:prolipoprotein diacylglycerol transferase
VWSKIVGVPLFGKTFTLYTFGPVLVVAFLVASAWLQRRARKDLGLDSDRVFNVAFALLFLGLAGARLLHVLVFYESYASRPMSFLYVWEGGLAWWGGLLAGLLWLAWWLPRHPEASGFRFSDLLARATCLGLAIGWIAPFLAGDQYGKPTEAPWGVPVRWLQDGTRALAASNVAARRGEIDLLEARLHPVQLYEALAALLLFLVLRAVSRRTSVAGRTTAVFLMLHAVSRAALDVFRWDERGWLIPRVGDSGFAVSTTQFLAVPVFFAGVALWLVRRPDRAPATTASARPGSPGGRP